MTGIDAQNSKTRYEAFTKFSDDLNRSQSFDMLAACFELHLKNILNFHVFRVSYRQGANCIQLTVSSKGAILAMGQQLPLLAYEQTLQEEGYSKCWTDITALALQDPFKLPASEEGRLWGWCFNQGPRELLVSLLSGRSREFSINGIPLLQLIAENLELKLLELCLLRELEEKNRKLQEALFAIDGKNTQIASIIELQRQNLSLSKEEIAAKNKKLLELSALNAHTLREPLSRILGLVSVLEYYDSLDDVKVEILPRLRKSSNDLDAALQDVISKATKDLLELKP